MFGGVKWVATVCKALVSTMALVYIIGCLLLLGLNYQYVGSAISLDRKSTRLNSSHITRSRMPSSA